jgi:hypothetical protein
VCVWCGEVYTATGFGDVYKSDEVSEIFSSSQFYNNNVKERLHFQVTEHLADTFAILRARSSGCTYFLDFKSHFVSISLCNQYCNHQQ